LNNIVGEAFRVAYAQQRLAMLSEQMRKAALSPSKTSAVTCNAPQGEKFTSSRTAAASQEAVTPVMQSAELTNGSDANVTRAKHSRREERVTSALLCRFPYETRAIRRRRCSINDNLLISCFHDGEVSALESKTGPTAAAFTRPVMRRLLIFDA
uniref:Uncharacterized protein n=1 Tax=Echinostoma caproni TaxID=27848 RepID=A0A183ANB8_9TREM